MTKPLRVDDEAAGELAAAAIWYEKRRPGLGSDLNASVRHAFLSIKSNPGAWSFAASIAPALGVRRFPLRRFPFAIIYLELETEIRVLAIAHGSREPGYWRTRL